MFSALLVALLGLGFTFKPVASCNPVINEVKEICVFYKYTALNGLEQEHAAQMITHFGSLFSSKCSNFSRISVVGYLFSFVFHPTTIFNPAANCAKKSSHHAFIFSRNSELHGQSLWTAQICHHWLIIDWSLSFSFFFLCFCLPCCLCICHLFSVRQLHVIVNPSIKPIKLTASMHSSSMSASSSYVPATSSHSTVHLQSRPTITPQSTSQGLILIHY